VSKSTISAHLAKLREAQLLTVQYDGRRRYYRLATPDVARLIERLARVAHPLPPRSLREGTAHRRCCGRDLISKLRRRDQAAVFVMVASKG
jgi:DNA-binding MarR family transcriptional regulator